MQRAFITGGAGLTGQALLASAPSVWTVTATVHDTPLPGGRAGVRVDLRDGAAVLQAIHDAEPDVVIHTAYRQSERAAVVDATANVTAACAESGARLVYLSSDCVFGGEAGPYCESAELDGAVDDYGRWKAETEAIVVAGVPNASIVRTSLLMAVDPPDPRSASIVEGLSAGTPVKLFVDELRCPLAVTDLAEALWRIAALDGSAASGVWHLAGDEALSRYSLGILIAAAHHVDPAGITPVHQADHPAPRARDVRLLIGRAKADLGFTPQTMAELISPLLCNTD